MSASKQDLIKAYRHLSKACLRAVQYAKPQRFVAQDHLRDAFRTKDGTFEPARIAKTLEFLDYATKERGLEHKILKNLIFVWWTRRYDKPPPQRRGDEALHKIAYLAFDETVRKLNDSMGLCLR